MVAKCERLAESHASRLSVSDVGHGDMENLIGGLTAGSIGLSDFWIMHPPFGEEPLPLLVEHPPHPFLGREGSVVRDARGLGSLAHGLPEDGDAPENLPRPFVDPSADGVLDLVGQFEQPRAFRANVFFGQEISKGGSKVSDWPCPHRSGSSA